MLYFYYDNFRILPAFRRIGQSGNLGGGGGFAPQRQNPRAPQAPQELEGLEIFIIKYKPLSRLLCRESSHLEV